MRLSCSSPSALTAAPFTSNATLAPLFGGQVLLDQVVWEATLPVLGKVKGGSALVFDLGVTLIVVGLVLAVLEGLGATTGDAGVVAAEPTKGDVA